MARVVVPALALLRPASSAIEYGVSFVHSIVMSACALTSPRMMTCVPKLRVAGAEIVHWASTTSPTPMVCVATVLPAKAGAAERTAVPVRSAAKRLIRFIMLHPNEPADQEPPMAQFGGRPSEYSCIVGAFSNQ